MANTTVHADNAVDQWAKKFFMEYVRDNRFKRYMGSDENSVIQTKMELTRMDGDDLTISLVTKLSGAGVAGDNTLEGNEEQLLNYGYKITVTQRRNAVVVGRAEQKKTMIGLLDAARTMLKMWAMEQLRDDIVNRMYCPVTDGTTLYASASEAQKDAWDTANGDRVLYGDATSNRSAGDHSAGLANIDNTNDQCTVANLSLAKRLAKTASPAIRPVRVGEDEEWYVYFCGSNLMRDFRSSIQTIHQNSMPRSKDNPLYRDGDLVWEGIIIREVPEIGSITGVGAGGIDVAAGFLCGAQAIGVAWGDRTHPISQETDYGNLKGVGVAEMLGVAKLVYNSVDHGLFTTWFASVAD